MDHDTSFYVAIVSLVIAIIAFFLSTAQTLQQFAASANGYQRCKGSIMGRWSRHTRRRFSFEEVRFKVTFKTPVFFVASPQNRLGPIPGEDIITIDGSPESERKTDCMDLSEKQHRTYSEVKEDPLSRSRGLHNADEEITAWNRLLKTLQEAERYGRTWDAQKSLATPKGAGIAVDYPLVVQLQAKQRGWDQMPDALQKPFAQTTLAHMVEMAVLLGMEWVTFDKDDWKFRAEGNGLMLSSANIWNLGIAVSFAISAKAEFGANRTIPCRAMQKLPFGTVPTIFEGFSLQYGASDPGKGGRLITERTLQRLQCDADHIELYFKHRGHTPSVHFEVISMLAQVFRLRGSNLRRIPNPTPDPWRELETLSGTRELYYLMRSYQQNLDLLQRNSEPSSQMVDITDMLNTQLCNKWIDEKKTDLSVEILESAHSVVDRCDKYLARVEGGDVSVRSVVGAHLMAMIDANSIPAMSPLFGYGLPIMDYYFGIVRMAICDFDHYRATFDKMTKSMDGFRHHGYGSEPASLDARGYTRQDIWLTLVFRSICWRMLHNFSETDTMILPSGLEGSRLPVFIL